MIKPLRIQSTLAILLLAGLTGCSNIAEKSQDTIEIPNLNLTLVPAEGWVLDDAVKLSDPAKGGVLIRLSPTPKLSGAPKLQVYLDPLRVKAPSLETLTQEQWSRINQLKEQPGLLIEKMEKSSVKILERDAMLLSQTYTLGSGPAQIAVSEQTWLMQHDNRGVAFVVSGRTELLSPWAKQIEEMLASLAPKEAQLN